MSWKSILSSIAPTIATALGGPVAGTATKFLAAKFLNDEDAPTSEVESFVLGANPDQLLAIKNADNEFKLQMEKAGIDVFKITADDKKNARFEHKHSIMPAILSVGLTLAVGAIIYLLFYLSPPEGSRDVLFMVLGVVIKEWGGSMQFWFGTTRSSANKDLRK
tara:strand:+ start:912 stop:1400 length:489 start_codon:yes stop_codon:yes gene_type:complete